MLKCPTDVAQLAAFLDVFPEAKVVLCHRDPFRTLTSSVRVMEVINGPFVAEQAPLLGDAADGARVLRMQAVAADAMVESAASTTDRVASVRYADLMADPAAVVVGAFEALSIDARPAHTTPSVERFLAAQRAGARAAPPSGYADYGHTPEQVRSHPSMRRYIDAFDVPVEGVRITEPVR